MPPWATPGTARSRFHGWTAASPTTKTSGWPGTVRSGPTRTRPLRSVSAPVAAATLRPNDEARTPAAQSTVWAWISSVSPVGVSTRTRPSSTSTTLVFVRTTTPSFSSWRRAEAERPGGNVASTRSIASTSTMRASCGLIDRKSLRSVSLAISPSAPASSTPVGPPPIEDEGHPRLPLDRIGLALGGLERDQDPAPDLRRVVDGLEARRVRRPVLVPEVGVMGAGGDDQRVVGHRAAVRQPDLALLGVDVDRLAEEHGRVALLAEDRAQRLRDLARRQRAGRDLVQHRLEQVVVPSVDEGDVDEVAGLAEVLGGVEAGEATADDDHAVRRRGGRAPWQGSCVHVSIVRPTAARAQWTTGR